MIDPAVEAMSPSAPTAGGRAWPWGEAPSSLLLIEDDGGDAFLLRELLAEAGVTAELIWVRSVAEAAEHLAAGQDCVLLDLHLPDCDGIAGLRRVLAMAADAPIVVVTGLHDEQAGLAAVAAGAQDYLIKGQMDGPLLARAIRYAIERKQAERTAQRLRDSELRAAENARLERGLLPRPMVRDPALRIEARYRAGRQRALLGGDFYDIVETGDGALRLLIGDVSGHGPDEAAIGASLRISWRALVLSGVPDATAVTLLEEILRAERVSQETYATVCLITLSPGRQMADVVWAGHPPPLVLGEETVPLAVKPQLPIALLDEPGDRTTDRLSLPSPGALLLYTDGLIDGRVAAGDERLGITGLVNVVSWLRRHPSRAPLVDRLLGVVSEMDAGRLEDDIAMVHLGWGDA